MDSKPDNYAHRLLFCGLPNIRSHKPTWKNFRNKRLSPIRQELPNQEIVPIRQELSNQEIVPTNLELQRQEIDSSTMFWTSEDVALSLERP